MRVVTWCASRHVASRTFGLAAFAFNAWLRLDASPPGPTAADAAFALGALALGLHFALRPAPLDRIFRWEKPFPPRPSGPDRLDALLVYGGAAGVLGGFLLH